MKVLGVSTILDCAILSGDRQYNFPAGTNYLKLVPS